MLTAGIALLATGFVVVGDRVGNSMVGKPVQGLIALTQAVGAGDLTPRVAPGGGDELVDGRDEPAGTPPAHGFGVARRIRRGFFRAGEGRADGGRGEQQQERASESGGHGGGT